MKILTGNQIKAVDAHTIEVDRITPLELMERASRSVSDWIIGKWNPSSGIKVFAGPGNNGGDALAVARMLSQAGYDVEAFLFKADKTLSKCCEQNLQRLQSACPAVHVTVVETQFTPPELSETDVVVDGLFGTGLRNPLNGGFASVVKYINASSATVVSIDVPSGLMCEDNTLNVMNHIIRADYTLTFQYPKLSFLFPENEEIVGQWHVLDIGLKEPEGDEAVTPYYITQKEDMAPLLKTRSKFAHKGSMGHAALVAGTQHMAGAAILSARACIRAGVGKLTVRTPEYNVMALQVAVPEAVLSVDSDIQCWAHTFDVSPYDAVAIGPGIGTRPATVQTLIEQISLSRQALVLDADALNIFGSHRGWVNQLPRNTILTPHKKELFGLISSTRNSYEELEVTRQLCVRQQIYIVIKGAFSAVCTPKGDVFYNTTGNPGMATAGCGDVLTGIILSLLAQDYPADVATRLGVYLHGLAGDKAAEVLGYEGVTASSMVDYLPLAFEELRR